MQWVIRLAVVGAMSWWGLEAQTTQGLISGSLVNSVTGRPVAGAGISFTSETLSATGTYQTDAAGYFFLPLLSPGTYSVRATANGYQTQELQQLELQVAGRIQIDFKLRPLSDVWEAGQYRSVFLPGSKTIVTFYGPDVDTSRSGSFEGQAGRRGTLDTSVSYVIDPVQIGDLPLQGRDVYAMLVSLPGVTADSGTGRGLGISVAGARPSASNYLLDGVENNNYLVTGPLNPVAPEAVQEYRISTNNYSAEYGRTAGFVANAVTRAGGPAYHGILYEYLKNDALNAADFADNLVGYGRLSDKENQFGYQAGGPILKNRLFFSSALEKLISHSLQNPQTAPFPTTNFIPALNLPTDRIARQLLQQYPGPTIISPTGALTANYTFAPPVVVNRLIALERADYTPVSGRDRFMARVNIARVNEPDFIWTPYTAFNSALNQNTTGAMGNWMHTWTPRLTSEAKISYSDDNLWWDRAHPEVPTLASGDGTQLPGSVAFYAYRNHNRSLEALYSTVWTRNRHVITAGAGLLVRFNDGYLTAGRDGQYIFPSVLSFAFDRPQFFEAAISRFAAVPTQPAYDRSYAYKQSFFFAQDSWRVSSRLTLNFGMRYERFGAPNNTGSEKDALVVPGPGSNFTQRLASATFSVPTGSGDEQLYGADNGDFAPRAGFSWDPFGKGNTVVRGGYGLFYDRPFDNLWQNLRTNGLVLPFYTVTGTGTTNYLAPIASVLPSYTNQSPGSDFPGLTLMDPKLRNGYSQSYFLGLQHAIGDNFTIEVNGTGAGGRRLVTTDIVNRQFTTTTGDGRPNESLPDVYWRSSQGTSSYLAMTTLVKYRFRTLQLQGSYTWSHAIDNQSDPLTGDFFDLNFTTLNSSSTALRSTFAQQYNSSGDRGNSDFDQRQNLFLLGIWRSDGRRLLTRGWQFSWVAAFRSGFPYSVLGNSFGESPDYGSSIIENQRASLNGAPFLPSARPTTGGILVLNSAAFVNPADPSVVGNTGRNAFRGPGLYNVDVSLARTFSVPKLPEGSKLTIRADAFNVLNHANLNNPDNLIGDPNFGVETYGRNGTASGFPATAPLNETARQFQLMLRLEF
jgi:hypothetical protein